MGLETSLIVGDFIQKFEYFNSQSLNIAIMDTERWIPKVHQT